MKLEDQVCSLELAKRLKELGVRQESEFYYGDMNASQRKAYREQFGEKWEVIFRPVWKDYPSIPCGWTHRYMFSAFTVAELGEMLPTFVKTEKYLCKGKPRFNTHEEETVECHSWHDDKEADARAKMLIHLIEKGLVKP